MPGEFEPSEHYYPRCLNAQIHATVHNFLSLSNEQLITRYCHTRPDYDRSEMQAWISGYRPKHMVWSGSDLMSVTERESGKALFTVIETNSCASGQKSNPLYDENVEEGGYGRLLRTCFLPELKRREAEGNLPKGELGVIYDKNLMEVTGYAAAMADMTGEPVHLIPAWSNLAMFGERVYKFENDILYVRRPTADPVVVLDEWVPIRAAFRYVTQKPWTKIPCVIPLGGTFIANPILACLAGGRNKLVAAKAYDAFNIELEAQCLPRIRTPLTIRDIKFPEVRKWVKKLGGHACIKVPYSNGGQGVYTITSEEELVEFEEKEVNNPYCLYIVQSLIANSNWSSHGFGGAGRTTLYHNGTVPNKKGKIFVCDLRVQVCADMENGGFRPVAMYARRAQKPLADRLPAPDGATSWEMLGTNLSVVRGNGLFSSESGRLLLMDRKDFNTLGLSLDNLIDAFFQAVLAHIAIDRMADFLAPSGSFNTQFFRAMCDDSQLINEVGAGEALNVKTIDKETKEVVVDGEVEIVAGDVETLAGEVEIVDGEKEEAVQE